MGATAQLSKNCGYTLRYGGAAGLCAATIGMPMNPLSTTSSWNLNHTSKLAVRLTLLVPAPEYPTPKAMTSCDVCTPPPTCTGTPYVGIHAFVDRYVCAAPTKFPGPEEKTASPRKSCPLSPMYHATLEGVGPWESAEIAPRELLVPPAMAYLETPVVPKTTLEYTS